MHPLHTRVWAAGWLLIIEHGWIALLRMHACMQVEIKPEMVGHYLAEFSISYKPTKHGRPGIGATHSSRFIPLK